MRGVERMSRCRNALHLVCALAICLAAATTNAQTRHIVVLYDERTDLPGLSALDESLVGSLRLRSQDQIEVYREAMDLSRFPSDTYLASFRDHLQTKYADKSIDVAIAVMGPALDFLLHHGTTIFPGTPIVFCGIDERELAGRTLPARVTGVLLKREFLPTLELVLGLHPDTERIVFVAGTSEFDTRLVEQAREEFRAYQGDIEFTYLTALPFADLLTRVSMLPPGTVVLYSTLFQDGSGQPFVPHEAAELLSQAANAPIYGFVDQYVGYGIVGGHLYTLKLHGDEAAALVLQVLAGSDPAELPVAEPDSSVTMFDWRQLQRWGIGEARLPPESIVRFRDESLWQEYGLYLIAGVAIFLLQALLIVALLLQRARGRRMERELRESEIRFRTMADTAPVMIWIADAAGHFTFLNKGWLDFTDSGLQQQLGETWTGRVHPDDLRHCVDIYDQALRDRKEFTVECRLLRHDTLYRWMICTGVPRFSEAGTFLGYIGSCVDISARQEAALEMQRHRIELAHLSRVATMGELAASIAHELNQPLTAILANTTVAQVMLAAERPELHEMRDILQDIGEDNRRAAEIIRRMRAFMQRHEIVPEPIEMNSLLEGIFRLVNIEAVARKVAMRFEPAGRPAYVSGDRVHLQQVILNLVLNGFDAMATVPDHKRQLTVSVEDDGNRMLTITVSDTGTGISPDMSEDLFRPFFTTKEKGLGMGLTIVRTIVEAHAGRVWVENNAGKGAAFHVVLPVIEAPP